VLAAGLDVVAAVVASVLAAGGTGSVTGTAVVVPVLEDAVPAEAKGVIFFAQPQTNIVSTAIENIFFMLVFFYSG
jgi:sugar (pentulose or hexulose) kinase